MTMGKMPRRFWSYTAGKGSVDAEERQAALEKRLQFLKENLLGMGMLGVILLLTLLMLLMMLAEFRGFYLDQIGELFRVR